MLTYLFWYRIKEITLDEMYHLLKPGTEVKTKFGSGEIIDLQYAADVVVVKLSYGIGYFQRADILEAVPLKALDAPSLKASAIIDPEDTGRS